MGSINSNIKQKFVLSFQQKCITLVCLAHDELCTRNTISQSMDEESISTCLASIIDDSNKAFEWEIHVSTEHRLTCANYIENPVLSKSLRRMDFRYEMDVWEKKDHPRLRYYMEAKNLYQFDFKKSTNSRVTSARKYFKRYIETGINHIVNGTYPLDTLLLGYVLVGGIDPVVDGINSELCSLNRSGEQLTPASIDDENKLRRRFISMHTGMNIEHLMLKFS